MFKKFIFALITLTIFVTASDITSNNKLLNITKSIITRDKSSVILNYKLCNYTKQNYYLENRFLPQKKSNILVGFSIMQDGKKLNYKGIRGKLAASLFPSDYRKIEPNKCIDIELNLSKYFNININKKAKITLDMFNINPISKDIDNYHFVFNYKNKGQVMKINHL